MRRDETRKTKKKRCFNIYKSTFSSFLLNTYTHIRIYMCVWKNINLFHIIIDTGMNGTQDERTLFELLYEYPRWVSRPDWNDYS